MTAEEKRLKEAWNEKVPWHRWGPYLSERQWGTVREDYSEDGNAWGYFTHDQARSRVYHWGEDGLAGISDDKQQLCFALALWNGKDPIIKERLFGLTNSEGNHGEDVKEYYFYLDSTPTHSYMKYLYKYPHNAYPYDNLVHTNCERDRKAYEYELIDTGVFDQDRYFDVFVEYAKESPEDLLIQISVFNRGPAPAELHVLPTLWFRNLWSWQSKVKKPVLRRVGNAIHAVHAELGERYLHCEGGAPLVFTENETNNRRLFGVPNASRYVKDGINDYLVQGLPDAINPEQTGTKAAAHYRVTVPPGGSEVIRLFLTDQAPRAPSSGKGRNSSPFGAGFAQMLKLRQEEADEFYKSVLPAVLSADETNVARQALAGMLWSKLYYHYDLDKWLEERGSDPYQIPRKISPRNEQWHHMYNGDIISMPDKWEYPWYAAWDLAFHVLALSLVDVQFSKEQLQMMLRERYMHPNGQMPAYEWNFSDVNPPVHAWATIFLYRLDKLKNGTGDIKWLKSCFRKLLLNFTWWVNRKDRIGRNVFEGGFLGLDNIGVFDRSKPLPTGGFLEQADGTAWMALYADNMLEIAIELAMIDDDYEDMALKFLQHDAWITS
ncbi:MAG TPA: glucosidase, partial [Verrucomicrobiae bacterium]|nr:glucosidase [Verrucomicrobiae bacterium]